jgi:hypothetical protein
MARKDEIFKSFLTHDLLISKYKLQDVEMPSTVRDGLNYKRPIIKAIAIIVERLEGSEPVTDSSLHNQIIQFLNVNAL